MNPGCFPLPMTSPGQHVCLECIHGSDSLTHRLAALGLTPGVELSIVQDTGDALLIAVRDSRIALGRGTANQVMVRPLGC